MHDVKVRVFGPNRSRIRFVERPTGGFQAVEVHSTGERHALRAIDRLLTAMNVEVLGAESLTTAAWHLERLLLAERGGGGLSPARSAEVATAVRDLVDSVDPPSRGIWDDESATNVDGDDDERGVTWIGDDGLN